ncbi:hypothetical protein LV89_02334 [Arcicella aurantiaca]|uniref:Uncharacterized protein n=1 Tax=Arcicella aurantiaca TaxID=591202 RepID=A0A316EAY4_9BACT|nr:hypothetical protein [Arcicella aurantiaca]PWK26489.1 hypothetical protein LV89_02334 [Arcicella aurantiaca]
MENVPSIENKLEQTLNSLNGIESAEPKPYFYSRLHARMERELLTPKTVWGWYFKPIYALSAVVIVLIINILTFKNLQRTETNPQQQYSLYDSGGF